MTPTNTPRDVTLPDDPMDILTWADMAKDVAFFLEMAWPVGEVRLQNAHTAFCALATLLGYRVTPLDAPGVMGGKDTKEDVE